MNSRGLQVHDLNLHLNFQERMITAEFAPPLPSLALLARPKEKFRLVVRGTFRLSVLGGRSARRAGSRGEPRARSRCCAAVAIR